MYLPVFFNQVLSQQVSFSWKLFNNQFFGLLFRIQYKPDRPVRLRNAICEDSFDIQTVVGSGWGVGEVGRTCMYSEKL